ncbi:cytochrome b/b6 domain-containing protein [Jatrophihabitans sp.]|uniref:cytochrome b/b6 domain-containing protein n=1 Tax=Jatrophihabitans sp. TaxID=1932789 RepID=UPI0030C6CD09|nr:fdnI [Jatrophihabitans sp.]
MTPLAPPAGSVHRFSASVRAVHWATTVLMLVCMLTAAVLYNGSLALAVGHRRDIELIHVYCGFGLPVPMFVGLVSRAYRLDLGRLNRFTRADWQWLRSRTRRDGTIKVGKFNAGQKLNAALTAGSILVLLGTGLLMYFPDWVRVSWRSGATFLHDWFALGVGLLVLGHINYARKDAEARRGMRAGVVSVAWARGEHEAWAEELGVSSSDQD